ncbi:uncharacterized protein EV420DRAFT_1653125 [Desarmillaria tabescens]|uniref:Uncharacterized protein n=1 Tax=Armillaria tabescens TaxID=1929756 RepID=A0AA39MJ98_ARMTA|nr:uncharacterized protein EV420DRAFT_1653125 [Desarmillaria tabescens]KAK0435455.1 hypothetical protein EV420DRAFT_1653125 [Desarmillaria tabescens]
MSTVPPRASYSYRVGTFLLPTVRSGLQPPVQWFITQGVSVWYPWTSHQAQEAQEWPHLFDAITPPVHILQELHAYLQQPVSPSGSSQNGHENASGPLTDIDSSALPDTSILNVDMLGGMFNPDSSTSLPFPAEGSPTLSTSGNLLGWISFFKARNKHNAQREKTESKQHHALRLGHEKNPPTTHARGLYEWVEDPFPDVCSDDEDFYGMDILDNDYNDGPYDAEADLASQKFQRMPSPDISVIEGHDDQKTEETPDFLYTLTSQFGFIPPIIVNDPLEVAQILSSSTADAILQFLGDISSKQNPAVGRWDVDPGDQQSLSFHPCLFTLKADPGSLLYIIGKMYTRIPFHTLVRLSNTFGAHKPLALPLISFQLVDYKFTARDYQAYVENCTNILSKPQGCTALLRGGIVWHLAKEHLSLDAALHGLSSTVTQNHTGFVFRDRGDAWSLWDDNLVNEEANLICGLYKCYTDSGLQVAFKSWWPLPFTWNVAGVNMGFWSGENEQWYQKRLQEILEGKAEPLGVDQWQNKLRGYPVTCKLQAGLYDLSCLPGLV